MSKGISINISLLSLCSDTICDGNKHNQVTVRLVGWYRTVFPNPTADMGTDNFW